LKKLKKRGREKKQKQIHLGKEKQAPSQSFASLNSPFFFLFPAFSSLSPSAGN
jgi:hypothetical protein